MSITRLVVGMFSAAMMVLGVGAVFGQNYPNKPIRIVTSTAGGGTDFVSRLIGQGISGPLGQNVIVDNRGSTVSGEVVFKAPPDGYTLLVIGSTLWIGSLFDKEIPYDPVRDFSPITVADSSPSVLVVHPSVPAKSVKELIALAKAKPGVLNYASASIGSPNHLGAELFKAMAGVDIVRINYKGSAPALAGVTTGEVHLMFANVTPAMPYVKAGKLMALAVTSAAPSALAPGLPTVAASGLPGYETSSPDTVFAPAKTPAAIINRLNQEIVRFISTPEAKEKFLNAGLEVVGSSPAELAARMKFDRATISKLIKDAGIKPE